MTTFKFTSGGPQHPVPPHSGDLPVLGTPRLYILSLRQSTDGKLEPYIVQGPHDYDHLNDGPLELKVTENCSITLQLDEDIDWEFDQVAPLTLGDTADKGTRYFDLQSLLAGDSNKCVGVSLTALRKDAIPGPANRDPYNLNFLVYLRQTDGRRISTPLSLAIDPDIKNPGDVVLVPPGLAKAGKPRKKKKS